MELNADYRERAVVHAEQQPWVDSPLPGVSRRLLHRIGGEVAVATSIVRYAPGSYFSPHVHSGGEEFFVLEGIFSDEDGDYRQGSYVRNPVGSRHQPFSKDGCTIFVKLQQMEPRDQEFVRVDSASKGWSPGLVAGLKVKPLFSRGPEQVALVRWQPGTQFHRHIHDGGEEILVLDGALEDESGRYPQGTWLRCPPGSIHQPFSQEGCTILVKTGHLPRLIAEAAQ
jgi:anti-sigma factor ChrR (cupin superfamily)|tara:strand:- start:6658 stop:7335 length:678 start_codon:yes stop_codon:yes gene_type:complete